MEDSKGMDNYLKKLREYFEGIDDVAMAFVFGSRAEGREMPSSDWDIAVYFFSEDYEELETEKEYPKEHQIWADVERIVKSEVDFLVLNRARPSLVFSILNSGIPLTIKDRTLYLKLLLKTHYEAVDYWRFTKEFYEIRKRAASISEEDKAILREHIIFLENEFMDLQKFQEMTWQEYREDRDKRRNLERWTENLVMSAIDIAKIVLASEKIELPQTYREALFLFVSKFADENSARDFSQFAELRNIVVHEYLDIKWKRIKDFIEKASRLYPLFIEKAKGFIV